MVLLLGPEAPAFEQEGHTASINYIGIGARGVIVTGMTEKIAGGSF